MTTKYRPGIKNIAAHIFGAVFSGAGLFHMVFIRPLAVGDRAGPTGAAHSRVSVVLTYAAAALVMLYCIYETIAMIRMRRNLERDLTATGDMTTQYRASTSDIVGRILGALFCGVCLFYFAFIGPITAGDTPRKLVDGATSFPLSSILIYGAFAFLLVYFVYETVMMLRAREGMEVGRKRPMDANTAVIWKCAFFGTCAAGVSSPLLGWSGLLPWMVSNGITVALLLLGVWIGQTRLVNREKSK